MARRALASPWLGCEPCPKRTSPSSACANELLRRVSFIGSPVKAVDASADMSRKSTYDETHS